MYDVPRARHQPRWQLDTEDIMKNIDLDYAATPTAVSIESARPRPRATEVSPRMSVDAGSRWRRVRFALPVALVIHLLFWLSLPTGLLDPLFNDSITGSAKGGTSSSSTRPAPTFCEGGPLPVHRHGPAPMAVQQVPSAASRHPRDAAQVFSPRGGLCRVGRLCRRAVRGAAGASPATRRPHSLPGRAVSEPDLHPVLPPPPPRADQLPHGGLAARAGSAGPAARSAPARRARPSGQLQREAQHPSCYCPRCLVELTCAG